jgi:hypothetical protein
MGSPVRNEVSAAARRLSALADRIRALRTELRPSSSGPPAPLFPPEAGGAGPLDDVELHFEIDEPGQSSP